MTYNYPPTKNITDLDKRKKLLKAVVYDFLKKKHALALFSDAYIFYNQLSSTCIKEMEKKHKQPILGICLNNAIDNMIQFHESFADFFFASRVSFGWGALNEDQRKKIESLDKEWTNLLGNLRDLR